MTGQQLLRWARRGLGPLGRIMSPARAAAAAVALVTGIALFVPPYIGMADNGDFFRIAYGNGLYFNEPGYDGLRFGHFVRQYGIFQYFNENASQVFSSQSLFMQAAVALNRLLFDPAVFDIRFQALLFTLLLVAAVYLLVEALTYGVSRGRGYVVAAMAVLLFGDTAYTAYFNSFYGESVVYVSVLFLIASWLLLYRNRFNNWAMLALFVASALVLTTSKQQNAPVGMIVAFMGIALIPLRKENLFRIATACSLVVLFVAGIASYLMISKEFVNVNQYHAMTRGVLMQSSDPEAALRSFGIDEQYAILKGTIHYEPFAVVDVNSKQLDSQFYSRYGFVSILRYYIAHPDQLGTMLETAAKQAFTIRPAAMGNYEASAGKPFGEQTAFFSLYSWLKHTFMPKTFGFIVLWAFIVIGLHMPSFVKAAKAKDANRAQKLVVLATIMLAGFSGIIVSIIGAGDADLAKHQFLFTLSFDLVTLVTAADIVGRQLFRDLPEQTGAHVPLPSRKKGVPAYVRQLGG